MATSAEIRISGMPERRELLRERLPCSEIERGDVVVRSQLGEDAPLNEHLVWLWSMLKHDRRLLKAVRQEGGHIECRCKVSKGPVSLRANAAEMLHLLGIDLLVEVPSRPERPTG
jgi:hypothetical protein